MQGRRGPKTGQGPARSRTSTLTLTSRIIYRSVCGGAGVVAVGSSVDARLPKVLVGYRGAV